MEPQFTWLSHATTHGHISVILKPSSPEGRMEKSSWVLQGHRLVHLPVTGRQKLDPSLFPLQPAAVRVWINLIILPSSLFLIMESLTFQLQSVQIWVTSALSSPCLHNQLPLATTHWYHAPPTLCPLLKFSFLSLTLNFKNSFTFLFIELIEGVLPQKWLALLPHSYDYNVTPPLRNQQGLSMTYPVKSSLVACLSMIWPGAALFPVSATMPSPSFLPTTCPKSSPPFLRAPPALHPDPAHFCALGSHANEWMNIPVVLNSNSQGSGAHYHECL